MTNVPPIISPPPPPGRRVRLGPWPWILAIVLILFYGLMAASAIAVVGFFRVSNTTQELRNGISKGLKGHLDKQLELRVGGISFGLARLVMAFTEVEPEIRAALNGIRAAEVGVYRVESADAQDGAGLQNAERGLVEEGWDRVVFVKDKKDAVAVYARPGKKAEELKFCVVVLNDHDLVVASIHSDFEELVSELIKGNHIKELKESLGLEQAKDNPRKTRRAGGDQAKRQKKN